MIFYYVLNDIGEPVLTNDETLWGECMKDVDRCRVGYDEKKGKTVSTAFLGVDHSFERGGPKILWETLVDDPPFYEMEIVERYSTLDEAKAGHQKWKERIIDGRKN